MHDNISKILNTAKDSRNKNLEVINTDLFVNTSKPTVHKLKFGESTDKGFKDYTLELIEESENYTYELEGNTLRITANE